MPGRVLTLALCLLTAAGCAREAAPGLTGSGSPQPEPITIELQANEKDPTGLLSYDGEDQPGQLGTRCWGTRCIDFIGPPTPKTFTEVPGDGVIEIRGDGKAESISIGSPPEEEFGQLVGERELPVRSGHAELDLEPGRYVLVVFARWDQGDAVVTFGLQVA